MSSKPYLLAVDDEAMNLSILEDLLEDDFDIYPVNNGQECLDSLQTKIPDVILLDVMMPILNGLDTCKQIRKNPEFQDIPIIFVSALASSKERMEGYEAGADDYLTKPFDEDELITKINLLLKTKIEKKKEVEEKEFATKTAMTSMISASEAGHLMIFMQSILVTKDISSIQQLIANILTNYSLSGCIMLNYLDEPCFFSPDGIIRPIEKDVLLEASSHSKKIIEFSGRAIFNSEHASFLIRKMPGDEEVTGRYKDHLAVLIDSVEAKLLQLITDNNRKQHYINLQTTIESISKNLDSVSQSYQQQRSLNTEIIGGLVQKIEHSFLNLGLEGSQEDALIRLITDAEEETNKVFENGKQSEATFDKIIIELSQLLDAT